MKNQNIEVTEIRIFPVKKPTKAGIIAYARIILNDSFVVMGLRLFKGIKSPYIVYPWEQDKKSGKKVQTCFPITARLRSHIQEQIINHYNLNKGN